MINTHRRKVGGIETYLSAIIPELRRRGHAIAFWYEIDGPGERAPVCLPDVETWCASGAQLDGGLAALRAWKPDLIYAHGMLSPTLQAEALRVSPGVLFAHSYVGTCISGGKTFKAPVAVPCERLFGWRCLFQYYPRHCGGWSPLTMVRLYRRERKQLEVLRAYRAIVVASAHMAREYERHGFREQVVCVPLFAQARQYRQGPVVRERQCLGEVRLLFLGRMEFLKGGHLLLQALPYVTEALRRPVSVIFAGDGSARAAWELRATQLTRRIRGLRIDFTGWVDEWEDRFAQCHLLVLPSIWPEPFGLVGLEAAGRGIPAASFGVGGVQEWLIDGVNGHVASGEPPTATGLAKAILQCVQDPDVYERLSLGALKVAEGFSLERHMRSLVEIFAQLR